ncbi:MAG: IclR family transcriptional regulator [Pseudooceanicola sp.]|nr:IclR family transcriptional regulator [Pseudooceanicola sp.]
MDEDGAQGGLQSLDAALALLLRLAQAPSAQSLSDLARAAGMPPSKAHRYLASFAHAGLVRQAGRSGKYDLGPAALDLGLAALARLDFVNRAADRLADLVAETGLTALLCVWSENGPVVIRWERSSRHMVTALGLGSTLPLLNSATGRVFLAFAPPALTAGRLAVEGGGGEALRARTRADGYASVTGDLIPGLAAIAAPVLDWQGEAQASVTLIDTDPARAAPESPALAALLRFCKGLGVAAR